jgi:hypothetical protein
VRTLLAVYILYDMESYLRFYRTGCGMKDELLVSCIPIPSYEA